MVFVPRRTSPPMNASKRIAAFRYAVAIDEVGKKEVSVMLILLIVVLVLLFGGGGGYYYGRGAGWGGPHYGGGLLGLVLIILLILWLTGNIGGPVIR
jgi:hypothetical protein